MYEVGAFLIYLKILILSDPYVKKGCTEFLTYRAKIILRTSKIPRAQPKILVFDRLKCGNGSGSGDDGSGDNGGGGGGSCDGDSGDGGSLVSK